MDWNSSTRTVRMSKTVCDEHEERGLDLDIVLPDYCPDITAVLKCSMKPTVTSRYQSGDRYTVDGIVTTRILYLTEDRTTVHCYEASQPFNVAFRCSGAVHYFVNTHNDYINCRAVSPRRMDIHGAFRVHLFAVGEGSTTVFEDPCRREVFCKKEIVNSTIPVSEFEKTLVVNEVMHLGCHADACLYADAHVTSCERKILTNKAIIKGTVSVKAVYTCDGNLKTITQEIPFSQILDADGLSEGMACDAEAVAGECEYMCRQHDNGTTVLDFACKLHCCIRCSRMETACVVSDVYSVSEPLLCETSPVRFYSCDEVEQTACVFQENTTLPEGLVSIEDQWCELKSQEFHQDDEMHCHILVCIIGRNKDGQLGYYERTLECNTKCDIPMGNVQARIVSSSCSLTGNGIKVVIGAALRTERANDRTVLTVSSVTPDTKRSFTKTAGTIRIVYADAGESVWNIAKEHHSSVEDICAENDLTDTTIHAATMLMIPMM